MRNILAILILTIFIFGCNDDVDNNDNNDDILMPEITLLSPLDTLIEHCNLTFEWETTDVEMVHTIEIALDKNFDEIVIQDSIEGSSYLLSKNLQPLQKYYWRVSIMDVEVMDSFEVKEIGILDFIGEHIVHLEISDIDSTYSGGIDTLKIMLSDRKVPILKDLDSNIIVASSEFSPSNNCNIFHYDGNGDIYWNSTSLNLEERTFTFFKKRGSNNYPIYYTYTGSID